MLQRIRVERQIGKGILSIETGALAKQAAGACTVQYGETVTLSAVATGPARPGIDFFPLTCDYRERQAAAGKFPGGFLKREGRPTTKETLTSRLIDRPIRPLFPEGFNDEVQIQTFVLASDRQNDGDVLAMNGASAALCISPLPFQGPLGVGAAGAASTASSSRSRRTTSWKTSELDLIVSGTRDAVLMIEGFAREMPEDRMVEAIVRGPSATSASSATCSRSWSTRSASRRRISCRRRTTACTIGCAGAYYDGSRQPSRPKASRPGPKRSAQLKAQALAEIDSRPDGRGRAVGRRVSARRGTIWKSRSSAI